jgi:hypothetical protein
VSAIAKSFRATGQRFRLAAALVLAAAASADCGDGSTSTSPNNPPAASSTTTTTSVSAFSLTGSWERIDSTFADLDGMVVEVNGAESEGTITSVRSNVYRFAPGDLKWRRIVKRTATEYDFEDLVRQAGSGRQSYVAGILEVQSNPQELRMRFPTTGSFQVWRRR